MMNYWIVKQCMMSAAVVPGRVLGEVSYRACMYASPATQHSALTPALPGVHASFSRVTLGQPNMTDRHCVLRCECSLLLSAKSVAKEISIVTVKPRCLSQVLLFCCHIQSVHVPVFNQYCGWMKHMYVCVQQGLYMWHLLSGVSKWGLLVYICMWGLLFSMCSLHLCRGSGSVSQAVSRLTSLCVASQTLHECFTHSVYLSFIRAHDILLF